MGLNLDKYQEARFQAFTDEVIRIEGGHVNDPDDPGGETNYGIAKRLAEAHGYKGRMIDLTKAEAKEIYRKAFWNDSLASNIMNDAAFNIYLLSIHSGHKQTTLILQRAVGVTDDGVIGANTLNAISNASEALLIEALCYRTLDFYVIISPKTQYKYIQGWRNRLLASRRINWKERINEYERLL
ncbi:hypothetical protein MMG00_12905 [Ignatzschineria rhizosphaerae]|uniref:Peptidoglycan domain protein n=1 Tax=Ignatzschineria rhizosphaerae TaxID=2923279 RepID=A0ABY3WY17_9GAMM|nr:glycosyl hydrolase 108 family protein [Ignatzschineria rhizosphaerae]UNM95503.1 hypothetical protein MMG00_09750 [Ignatzschineria rhizosphaerae]UNM96081.1 hypothetical protein MMG00_12905 [Ignatzschineria rhizosphaerae]